MLNLYNEITQPIFELQSESLLGTRSRTPLTRPDLNFDLSISLDLDLGPKWLNFYNVITQLIFELGA